MRRDGGERDRGHDVDDCGARQQQRGKRRQLGADDGRAADRKRSEHHGIAAVESERVPGECGDHAHRDDAVGDEDGREQPDERIQHLRESNGGEFERCRISWSRDQHEPGVIRNARTPMIA